MATPQQKEPSYPANLNNLIVILGAGEMGSACAYRLHEAGYPVVLTELELPTMLRTVVSYGAAVQYHAAIVEGVRTRRVPADQVRECLADGTIPILIDPNGEAARTLNPRAVIDARGIGGDHQLADAPLLIGIGEGFTAGVNCHAAIEIATPADARLILHAPADGVVRQIKCVGQWVSEGEEIAVIGGVSLIAPLAGRLRGLIDDDTIVRQGMNAAEITPQLPRWQCHLWSDEALDISGRVLETVARAI
ncbi:MAG: FAD-binding oxidoreductase [Anaerolineae bacterium]|nr:hypothetical protein [Anaerolineae bacterium]